MRLRRSPRPAAGGTTGNIERGGVHLRSLRAVRWRYSGGAGSGHRARRGVQAVVIRRRADRRAAHRVLGPHLPARREVWSYRHRAPGGVQTTVIETAGCRACSSLRRRRSPGLAAGGWRLAAQSRGRRMPRRPLGSRLHRLRRPLGGLLGRIAHRTGCARLPAQRAVRGRGIECGVHLDSWRSVRLDDLGPVALWGCGVQASSSASCWRSPPRLADGWWRPPSDAQKTASRGRCARASSPESSWRRGSRLAIGRRRPLPVGRRRHQAGGVPGPRRPSAGARAAARHGRRVGPGYPARCSGPAAAICRCTGDGIHLAAPPPKI